MNDEPSIFDPETWGIVWNDLARWIPDMEKEHEADALRDMRARSSGDSLQGSVPLAVHEVSPIGRP